jgi:hypothetical protein
MLGDKKFPASEKEVIEVEQKVTRLVKDGAIKAGLEPEDV